MRHSTIPRCIYTPNLGFLSQRIQDICSVHTYSKTRSEAKVSVTRKWYTTLYHPKMHSYTKFGFPTSKNIEDMHQTQCRNQVRGQGHSDPRMVRDFVIPSCMHIPNLGFLRDLFASSEIKVNITVPQKLYATLRHSNIHPHTKFGIPASNNIMHRTRSGKDRRADNVISICLPKFLLGYNKSHF